MGNHEYCEDCGESSFHLGGECDPIKKANVIIRRKLDEEREIIGRREANRLCDFFKTCGYPAKINIDGHVEISWYALADLKKIERR